MTTTASITFDAKRDETGGGTWPGLRQKQKMKCGEELLREPPLASSWSGLLFESLHHALLTLETLLPPIESLAGNLIVVQTTDNETLLRNQAKALVKKMLFSTQTLQTKGV